MAPFYQYFRANAEGLGERFGPLVHLPTRLGLGRRPTMGEGRPFTGFQGQRRAPDTIMVQELGQASELEVLQARVRQGLLNRLGPRLYLVQDDIDRYWLEKLQTRTKTFEPDLEDKGPLVLFDLRSRIQTHLAVTLAGIHEARPTTKNQNGAQVFIDLRDLPKQALLDLFLETVSQTSHQSLALSNRPVPEFTDLVVKYGLFISPLALSSELRPVPVKRRSKRELVHMEQLFDHFGPDSAVLGYNINPEIAGEYETLDFLSRRGAFQVPTPRVTNLSFFSGLPRSPGKVQPPQQSMPTPMRNKVYLAFAFSDGDNLKLTHRRVEHFDQPHTTPIAWSISPLLYDLAPNLLEHYQTNLQPGDTLVAGPSGAGFTYPSRNPELGAFLAHTQCYMEACGLRYSWVLDLPWRGYDKRIMASYAQQCDGILAEFANRRSYRSSIEFHKGTPVVFSSAFVQHGDQLAATVMRRTPRRGKGPIFLFFTLSAWHVSPQMVDEQVAKLGARHEVLGLPEFFAYLLKTRGGW